MKLLGEMRLWPAAIVEVINGENRTQLGESFCIYFLNLILKHILASAYCTVKLKSLTQLTSDFIVRPKGFVFFAPLVRRVLKRFSIRYWENVAYPF